MNKGTIRRSSFDSLRLGSAVVFYLIPAAVFAQGIIDIRIDTPRDFGYSIGDRIRHEMHLTLREPIRLDTTTLPETVRLDRWLEISWAEADVRYHRQIAIYKIVVEYQILNAPQQLTSVTIPQLEFLTTGGANPIPVFIPEWTFSIGPITNSEARGELILQPDRQPRAIPVFGRRVRLLTWALLLGGFLIYLLYRRFLLPRLKRNRYPFSIALAELRSLQRMDSEPENYRLALRAFHGAMNATAGEVVFAGNLDAFLAANLKFAALKEDISALYSLSQDVFFNSSEVAEPKSSLQQLVDLCRHCHALERSVA